MDVIKAVTDLVAERDQCYETIEKQFDRLVDRDARIDELEEEVERLTDELEAAVRDREETKRDNVDLLNKNADLLQNDAAWKIGSWIIGAVYAVLLAALVLLL